MELAFLYGALALAAAWMYYYRDQSIDLKKETTRRPVIKFRMYQIKKVADKETQTATPLTPMSLSPISLDFPFNFDEDYLNLNDSPILSPKVYANRIG